ncbi:arylamine N-acetyltransferase [Pseudobacillus wudalianchiensis]|uniref:Acetyltransferase n=1 Tax=Pseudobacillus wudalianchiensis TaxID=1743143 RepID=A0A1B9AGD3_9BACI|nr:arylamine N-acetyltransferase [Bacillus wudalianchiensis]OCA82911.1 acetyltransferase [Bacillus wudalianchiensis]
MDAVSAYLKQLKMNREKPSLNYLQRLIQHHLSLIPYETFSKFHYFNEQGCEVPTFTQFVDNLKSRGWGGTCYSLNMNFARLLEQLGFSCSFVRVLPGHAAIMVHMADRKFYVDVGYGSPITRPIELNNRPKHVLHGFGEEIIFTGRNEKEFQLERRSHGKTFVTKQIIWEPLTEEELQQDIEESYKDSDNNITMRRISAVRFQGNNCYFLRNETLKVINYRDIREYHFREPAQWISTVAEAFQLDEKGIEESLVFLADRGIYVFDKETQSEK